MKKNYFILIGLLIIAICACQNPQQNSNREESANSGLQKNGRN